MIVQGKKGTSHRYQNGSSALASSTNPLTIRNDFSVFNDIS